MQYFSTRGQAPTLSFEEVVLAGLAPDGGLYLPESLPTFTSADLREMRAMDYETLAQTIMYPFVEGSISPQTLRTCVQQAYGSFRHTAVAPLIQIGQNQWIMELFHGPTLAFKDIALQFLGRLVADLLAKRGEKVVVLGATSGDTGSAAIAGCQGLSQMQCVILYPEGRVSEVQRRQMTTWNAPNIHAVAVEGSFDDCQAIVKQLFVNEALRSRHRLVAVNSINWARLLAQVVYYFWAGLRMGAPDVPCAFSVPTGNFGDIYAGYIAMRCGLPVEKLMIATNHNDILARCLHTGSYTTHRVSPSLSPSMDIQVSSNFERLLYDLNNQNPTIVREQMQQLREQGTFTLSASAHAQLTQHFAAHRVDDARTIAVIKAVYERTGYVLDPHTATGVDAATMLEVDKDIPVITLATAHPAKFPDAVKQACGVTPSLPAHLADLFDRKEHTHTLPNDAQQVIQFLDQLEAV